jgi:hypothetical protein
MTTDVVPESEWTASALRPTAQWVPVSSPDGSTRLEMIWSVPSVTVPQVVSAA